MYEWMPDAIEQAKTVFRQLALPWGFKLGIPASEEDISWCERSLDLSLPVSYRKFLLKYNGAQLFCSAHDPNNHLENREDIMSPCSGVFLFGIEDIIKQKARIYDWFKNDEDFPVEEYSSILPVAYLDRIRTGDFCSLYLNCGPGIEPPVLDCDHEKLPSDWKKAVIADSLERWISDMFYCVISDKNIPEYWIDEFSRPLIELTD